MDVERALSGEAGLAGVHSLLGGPGRAAVIHEIRSMLRPDRRLRSLRTRRVHFKPGKKLAVYYEAQTGASDTTTPVAVTWYATPQVLDRRLDPVQRELTRRRIPTPFDSLWSARLAGTMLVTVAPLDPVFPSLASLADPVGAAAVLDRYLRVEPVDGAPVRFARYRPGQRHVLAYGEQPRTAAFVKLYRPGESEQIAGRVTGFARAAGSLSVPCVRVVEPCAVLTEVDALLYERVPGTTLSDHLRTGRPVPRDLLVAVGRWLRALHEMFAEPGAQFPNRDFDSEAARVMRACAAMRGLRPELAARAAALVARTSGLLDAVDQEQAVLVHGDMKADHLLCSESGVGILDTDSCARADPALDVGKLLADLHWWTLQGGHPEQRADAEAATLAGYAPGRSRLTRARLYAALFLIKMAGRRVSVARRDWARSTSGVLDHAAQLLDAEAATIAP